MGRAAGDPGTNGPQWVSTWADAVDGLTRALQLGADLQRRMTRSSWSSLDPGPGSRRDAQEEWQRYAARVTELTVEYYRAVAEAARDHGERLAADRGVDHHDRPSQAGHEDERGTRRAVSEQPDGPAIELRGRTGAVLTTSFLVENRDPDPAAVTITAGLAHAPDGERFVAPLSVDPASLTIPAGGTAEVGLRVPLLAEVFATDVTYRVPLRVDGPRPATIDVLVVAEAAVSGGAGGGSAGSDTTVHAGGSDAHDGSAADAVDSYGVRCPACGRTFERRTADLRLRPHKAPNGDDCPEREGHRVGR